jgi:hypothetical protein
MEIEVINWEKYNRRTDYHCSWFRLNDDIFNNPTFPELYGDEFKCFIFILCVTCQKQGKAWFFDENRVSKLSGCKKSAILSCVKKLEQFQIVRIRSDSGPIPFETVLTNERTNEHNEHDQRTVFDFDSLYQQYPKKEGKTLGLKKCEKEIKTEESYSRLKQAIENYAKKCSLESTPKKYIKQFSSFMNCWGDYVEVEINRPTEGMHWGSEDGL